MHNIYNSDQTFPVLDAYKKCMSQNYIDASADLQNKTFMTALLKN